MQTLPLLLDCGNFTKKKFKAAIDLIFEKLLPNQAIMKSRYHQLMISLQTIYGLPAAGGVFAAYIVPGYLLGGLHSDLSIFYFFIGN